MFKNALCKLEIYFIILIISVNLLHNSIAQQVTELDSLLLVLKNENQDSNCVNKLNDISKQLWSLSSNYEEAIRFADTALRIAKTIFFIKGIAISYYNIGSAFDKQGNYSDALLKYLASLRIYEEIEDKQGIADSHYSLGLIYMNQGNYPEAIKHYSISLKINEEKKDKISIAIHYNKFGIIYLNLGNYPEALKYHLASLKVRLELEDKKGIAESYNNIGRVHVDQGNYSDGLKNYFTSLEIREKIGDKNGIAASYNNIGTIHSVQGNYSEGLKYYLAALKIREDLGVKNGLSILYFNIGNIYIELGNYPEALNYYLVALKIAKDTGNNIGIADAYNYIGEIYIEQGNYSEGLKNCMAALRIGKELGYNHVIATSYTCIGNIHLRQANYPEALKNHLASLNMAIEGESKRGIAASCNYIGSIYTKQGNYSEAQGIYLTVLKIYKELGEKGGIYDSYHNLGRTNIKLSNPSEAKVNFENALAISREIGIKDQIKEVYKSLAELDSIMGNNQQAFEHYKLYSVYKDSLLNESIRKTIVEMQTKFDAEKKDEEIKILKSEKQIRDLKLLVQQELLNRMQAEKVKFQTENLFSIQQVLLLGNEKKLQKLEIEKNQIDFLTQIIESNRKQDQVILLIKESVIQRLELQKQTLLKNYIICGLILFGLLFYFVYNNNINDQKLKLQSLRNRIASDLHHDVGSTLSSISMLSQIANEQSREVIPLLDTIGENSRKMLDAMADIVWTINPENDQFELIILRMRSFAYELLGAKGIDFEFVADENITKIKLPMDVRKNLYLIFKEATNNMVKYAEASKAMFSIKGEKDILSLIIHDNGKGFEMSKLSEGNGIKNMKNRAEEIKAKLNIESFPGRGTTIQLKIVL